MGLPLVPFFIWVMFVIGGEFDCHCVFRPWLSVSSRALSSFSSSILFPSVPFDTSAYIRQWVEWSFSHWCYVFIILQWCHGCFRTASWRYYCPVIFSILLSPFLRHFTRHIPFNNKNLAFSQWADHSARCFIDRLALSSAYMEDLMTTGP